jgi:hypothetical protein
MTPMEPYGVINVLINNSCPEAANQGQIIGHNCAHKPYDAILFSDESRRCGATRDAFLWAIFLRVARDSPEAVPCTRWRLISEVNTIRPRLLRVTVGV